MADRVLLGHRKLCPLAASLWNLRPDTLWYQSCRDVAVILHDRDGRWAADHRNEMLLLLSANLGCLRARIHWDPWYRDGFINQDEKDGKPFHLEIRMSSRQRPLAASHAHQAHCIRWNPWCRDEHAVPGGKGDKGT